MRLRTSLAELRERGVNLTAHEAVAIVQKLIDGDATFDPRPPFGPPSADKLLLNSDGTLICCGSEATPSPLEAGILLQGLMPAGIVRATGGLRYTIARALLEVDAAPFDSAHELYKVLARFELGDRDVLLQRLVARAGIADRRRNAPASDDLRRALREAERQVYELRAAAAAASAAPAGAAGVPDRSLRRILRAPIAAGIAAGLTLVAAGELMHWRPQFATDPAPARLDASRIPASDAGANRIAVSPPEVASQLGNTSDVGIPRSQVGGLYSATSQALIGRRPSAAAGAPSVAAPGSARRAAAEPSDAFEGIVVRALDSEQRPVFSPAFASNGTAMFFHRGPSSTRSALMSAEESDGELRVMTIVDDGAKNYHVQPSPDGRLIAFDSDRDGERGVYIANRDGTGVKRVSGGGYAAVPTWAPDGQRLAFIRAEAADPRVWNLWLLSLQSRDLRRLTSFRYGQTWSASWFPDGNRIAFTHEDRLIVRDLASESLQEYRTPVSGRLMRTPAVSPDGSRIIFQVYRDGAWLLELEDGSMRRVLTDPTAEEFAWSRDGRRVAFHSRRDGEWGIWVLGGV